MLERQNQLDLSDSDTQDIFGKTGNGTLDFYLSKSMDWSDTNIHDLNVSIWTADFDAIYACALKATETEPMDTSGQYNWENFERNRQRFAAEFPQFPLMISYEDMYQDYVLGPNEISALLKECRALQQNPLSREADLALRKLIYGCEEAAKDNAYLLFICD